MSSTPSIRISHHRRYPTPPAPPAFTTAPSPMAIPHARDPVPPPLPPPSYIPELSAGQDPGWQWGNDPNRSDFGRPAAVKPGSSLLGGGTGNARRDQEWEGFSQNPFNDARRGSSISTITGGRSHDMSDEPCGYSEEQRSIPPISSLSSSKGLKSERQLGQWTLEESSQSYDKQLLNSLGGPNTPKRGSTSSGLGTLQENQQLAPHEIERRNSSLRPLSVPERRHNSVDSPNSSRLPSSGAISPGFTGFWSEHGPSADSRAPTTRHGSLTFDDSVSHRGSYDHSFFLHDDMGMEDNQMSNLNIHDRSPGSPRSGSKRRASSPPREREDRSSLSSASGHSEIYHRRSMQQLPNRTSPVSRFHPNHSSVSSASSFGPRHGSLGSSLSIPSIPSSTTSYASGRISPGGVSPALDSELRMNNVYPAQRSANPAAVAHHQRALSENVPPGPRKMSASSAPYSRHGSLSQMQGLFICECCPKKPKKFDSEDELRLHETEKQYTCAYCTNRFKNKNEAERHQNSLHLRKHSWSCAVLSGIEAAFHPSSNTTHADACGYCGKEFPNNPPQWDVRADHLNHVHKFGECNQSKKFFRADHFRQHLKHSHHGTSGKWTNMLENACMKDEPPPIPLAQQQQQQNAPAPAAMVTPPSTATTPPPALVVRPAGVSSTGGPGPPAPARIDETPNES